MDDPEPDELLEEAPDEEPDEEPDEGLDDALEEEELDEDGAEAVEQTGELLCNFLYLLSLVQ